jgi:mannose-1-phosphate guanylyltransferase
VVAAHPEAAEPDYGWIEPAVPSRLWISHRFLADPLEVRAFHEKPDPRHAEQLFASGGLWSTMVLLFKADLLWALAWRCLPEAMPAFEAIRREAMHDGGWLRCAPVVEALGELPSLDLSREILASCPEHLLVLPLNNVQWCDWGRLSRVVATCRRLGRQSAFAVAGGDSANEEERVSAEAG